MSLKEILDDLVPYGYEDFCYGENGITYWMMHKINMQSEYGEMIEYRCQDCGARKYLTVDKALEKKYEEEIRNEGRNIL